MIISPPSSTSTLHLGFFHSIFSLLLPSFISCVGQTFPSLLLYKLERLINFYICEFPNFPFASLSLRAKERFPFYFFLSKPKYRIFVLSKHTRQPPYTHTENLHRHPKRLLDFPTRFLFYIPPVCTQLHHIHHTQNTDFISLEAGLSYNKNGN